MYTSPNKAWQVYLTFGECSGRSHALRGTFHPPASPDPALKRRVAVEAIQTHGSTCNGATIRTTDLVCHLLVKLALARLHWFCLSRFTGDMLGPIKMIIKMCRYVWISCISDTDEHRHSILSNECQLKLFCHGGDNKRILNDDTNVIDMANALGHEHLDLECRVWCVPTL